MADHSKPESGPLPWWQGWAPMLLLPMAALVFTPDQWPPWAHMWLLAWAIFCACKWLTWRRTVIVPAVPLWRHGGYLLAWPGLDAPSFLRPTAAARILLPSALEWFAASLKTLLGLALIGWGVALVPDSLPYGAGWIGMIGLVLLLHFGLFHLASCTWRQIGLQARPLMERPLFATSLADFWGRRWNTAFRDLTHRFLFRPLSRTLGPRRALWAGFIFSGLVHDLVISWPAGAGYGGPTLFFLLQAAGITFERSRLGRSWGLGRGYRGWAFTLLCLLAPVGLLFHRPFVLEVVIPFIEALLILWEVGNV